MPQIDMPLVELKEYKGISPCPTDFDTYWDNALKEMYALDSSVELVESDFQVPFAKCYDLYFTGMKGARIHAKFVTPVDLEGEKPAILKFHGYTWNAGDWSDLLKYAAMGHVIASMDCRGQGGLSEDVGGVKGPTLYGHIVTGLVSGKEELLYKYIFLDTAQLAKIVMNLHYVDENRVGVIGGSQGGALTLACAALEPRIKKLTPVYPFLSDYRRVWEMDMAERAYVGIKDYLRRFDPTHENIDTFFNTLGYIDIQNLAKRIKGEVLFATGLIDNICPPSTQFAVFNKIQSKKEMVIYPDFGHEGLPGFADKEIQFMSSL